jgi:hypothetical protein
MSQSMPPVSITLIEQQFSIWFSGAFSALCWRLSVGSGLVGLLG